MNRNQHAKQERVEVNPLSCVLTDSRMLRNCYTLAPSVGEKENHLANLGATFWLYLVIAGDAFVHNVVQVH